MTSNIFENIDRIRDFIEAKEFSEGQAENKTKSLELCNKIKAQFEDFTNFSTHNLEPLAPRDKRSISLIIHPDKNNNSDEAKQIFQLFNNISHKLRFPPTKLSLKEELNQYQELKKQPPKPLSEKKTEPESSKNIFLILNEIGTELDRKISQEDNPDKKFELQITKIRFDKIRNLFLNNSLPTQTVRETFIEDLTLKLNYELANKCQNGFQEFRKLVISDREQLVKKEKESSQNQTSADRFLNDEKKQELADVLVNKYFSLQQNIDNKSCDFFLIQFRKEFNYDFPQERELIRKLFIDQLANKKVSIKNDGSINIENEESDTASASKINTAIEFLASQNKLTKAEQKKLGIDDGLPDFEEIYNSAKTRIDKIVTGIEKSLENLIPQPQETESGSEFLFESNSSIPIPDHKKEQLAEILAKKYEELYNKRSTDDQAKIFFKFFSQDFNSYILKNPESHNAPEPKIFKKELQKFFSENSIKIYPLGGIEIIEKDEFSYDETTEIFQFFLYQKKSSLTKEEFKRLQIDKTPHYQTASSQSSQPDDPSNHDIGSTLDQLSAPFNQLAQSINNALVTPAHDLWKKAHENLQKSPALPTFFPPKIEPQSSVQNFNWLQQSIREIGNSLQEIRNPFEGRNVQQLIGFFQPKPQVSQPDSTKSSSPASSAQTMLQKRAKERNDPNTSNDSSSSQTGSAKSPSTSTRSSSTSQNTNLSRSNTHQNQSSSSQERPRNISPAPTKAPPSPVAIFGNNAINRAKTLAMKNPGQPFAAGNTKFTLDPKTKQMITEKLEKPPSKKPGTKRSSSLQNPSPTKTPTRER